MYYEVSMHAIPEGWKLLGIHMCLEGFLPLFWTRKQKYLHLHEKTEIARKSFVNGKIKFRSS